MTTRILEIIACSLADAQAAACGGATRLEIISHFDKGGLTPPLALVRAIQASVSIPARVMLRDVEDFAVSDEGARQRLCDTAAALAELGVEGLVCGFLRDGEIDVELLSRVLAAAPTLRVTFHRAFEEVRAPLRAIALLKELPQIDALLTSGGGGDWAGKAASLRRLAEAAAPEISLLVGGGVDLHLCQFLLHSTPIRAFHLGRAARRPTTADGVVDAASVGEFARLLQWK